MRKHFTPGVTLGVIAIVLAMSGSAVAGSLITSGQIKDGTIQNKDIKKGSIAVDRLTAATQKAIKLAGTPGKTGATGATGSTGATGATGADGRPGTTVQASPGVAPTAGNWGIVNRNTIGSPAAYLRSGPFTPPLGKGSLNFSVKDGTEKVAFGNEIDSFAGGLFSNLTQVGFNVYNTGENIENKSSTPAGAGPNMPGITFEIDPNIAGKSHYSTLVFMPNTSAANKWSGYIDATLASAGYWGGTGGAFAGTKCDINGTRCTFDELQDYLDDGGAAPTIMSVAVGKGRDWAWSGAVDGLRINDTVVDFEETGVFTTTS